MTSIWRAAAFHAIGVMTAAAGLALILLAALAETSLAWAVGGAALVVAGLLVTA